MGRPAQKGPALPKLKTLLSNPDTAWTRITVSAWYGHAHSKALDRPSYRDRATGRFRGRRHGDPKTASSVCDHGYVDYVIPPDARPVGLFLWHSSSARA